MHHDRHIRPTLGVSSCLVGQKVRYDGNHKKISFITDLLVRFVDLLPVCPEAESGMGVPRPRMHLVGEEGRVRLVTSATGREHTADMQAFADRKLAWLEQQSLCGYIFKSRSPSCGLGSTPIYNANGQEVLDRTGSGLFAQRWRERFAHRPAIEEVDLEHVERREHFLTWVFALARFLAVRDVTEFHRYHRTLLHAHHSELARELDRLIAGSRESKAYERLLTQVLARPVSHARHIEVLCELAEPVRQAGNPKLRRQLSELLDAYASGRVSSFQARQQLLGWAEQLAVKEVAEQWYLSPVPAELLSVSWDLQWAVGLESTLDEWTGDEDDGL